MRLGLDSLETATFFFNTLSCLVVLIIQPFFISIDTFPICAIKFYRALGMPHNSTLQQLLCTITIYTRREYDMCVCVRACVFVAARGIRKRAASEMKISHISERV